jgi:hypothetical protein
MSNKYNYLQQIRAAMGNSALTQEQCDAETNKLLAQFRKWQDRQFQAMDMILHHEAAKYNRGNVGFDDATREKFIFGTRVRGTAFGEHGEMLGLRDGVCMGFLVKEGLQCLVILWDDADATISIRTQVSGLEVLKA